MAERVEAFAKDIDVTKEYDEASAILQTMGLTSYESRAYIALVAHGYGNADTIAETAKIPRTSAYKALQSLCEKGYAISTRGRPIVYKPEPPAKLKEKAIERISTVFDKLQLFHEILMDKGEPQLVFTITGKQRVLTKIAELLDTATKTFIISTPILFEIREELSKKIESAVNRGVEITVITEPMQRVPDGAKPVWKKGLIATDIISDGERALIASPDLNACGYTDNASLAKHLENFLMILMGE